MNLSYEDTNIDVIRVHDIIIYVANLNGVSLVDGFKNPPPLQYNCTPPEIEPFEAHDEGTYHVVVMKCVGMPLIDMYRLKNSPPRLKSGCHDLTMIRTQLNLYIDSWFID